MNITHNLSPNFGWDIKTHLAITEHATEDDNRISKTEKRMLARFSQMPDLMPEELDDCIAAHFYDVLHEDPSYGTKDDDKNNALSKFLSHTQLALKKTNREEFLREVGYASHYLQDSATPPHTEHGNYLQKLYRLPMHINFEKGEDVGTNKRLELLKKGYVYEDISCSSLKALCHNNALYSVQPENHVGYRNIKKWGDIQQRCYNRSVNSTKAYLDYMLDYAPKSEKIDISA